MNNALRAQHTKCTMVFPASAQQVVASFASISTPSWVLAAGSGIAALAAQFVLHEVFRRSKDDSIRSRAPGFFAYNAIACALMIASSIVGILAVFTPGAWPATAEGRLLTANGASRVLCAILFGELVLWDLPCTLWISKLRRPDMILHHLAMAFVCWLTISSAVPMSWALFFFGISEISTIPLGINDHYGRAVDLLEEHEGDAATPSAQLVRLRSRRDISQAFAAAAFVLMRGIAFPLVSFRGVGLDVFNVVRSGAAVACGGAALSMRLQLNFWITVAFSLLQWYWLGLLIRFTVTNGLGGKRPD